ncbi:LamG-like jellyroll fold domain-containing protein [Brevibacillus gelatini]
MATIGQLLTAPEAGWKRYDDTDPSFKYIGIYAIVSNNDRFKGSSRYSLNKAARIKFDFIGTKLRIVHTLGDDRVNTVVKIDGVAEVYNAKSETILGGQYLVYEKTGLTRSRHTVEIYHSNDAVEGVNPLVFDAIDIDDTGRILHPDEVTDIRSLAINKRIRCHYTASSNTFGIFSGLGKETSHFIPLTSSTTPNGDFYFICVDKDYLGRLILVSDRNIQSGISWDALNTAGVASGSGKPLMYNPTSSLVAWYTFDANASTLANNVDGTNGTIIGTTVVDGFKGKARQFNGVNDYIVVPGQKVIPAGKKSIRFKIKVPRKPSDYGMILGNGFSTSEHGTRVQVNANGDINVVMTYGTSSNSFSLTATGYNVCDGQWHDVFITWDGTTSADSYKIYIDDMTVPKKTGNPTFTQTVNGSRNFTIGRRADANDRFFFGVIDEIEIYNDVVDPLNTTPYLDGYVISLRLPTGGIDSTDTDNEWDKYVVNSTLNGTITAGDDTVWNWSGLYTLCSTTSGASGQRTIRGKLLGSCFLQYCHLTRGFVPTGSSHRRLTS